MVRKTTRRGKRVLVIDFTYTKPDGTQGRYRRDAAVQTTAAAQTEEAARKLGATLHGDPENPVRGERAAAAAGRRPHSRRRLRRSRRSGRWSRGTSPSTRLRRWRRRRCDGYRSKLGTHLLPRLGELPVSEAFEVARSREVDVAMIEAGRSISTRHNTFFALRSVAKYAVEAKLLAKRAQVPSALPSGASACPARRPPGTSRRSSTRRAARSTSS